MVTPRIVVGAVAPGGVYRTLTLVGSIIWPAGALGMVYWQGTCVLARILFIVSRNCAAVFCVTSTMRAICEPPAIATASRSGWFGGFGSRSQVVPGLMTPMT